MQQDQPQIPGAERASAAMASTGASAKGFAMAALAEGMLTTGVAAVWVVV
jgi:hypothetical protein